MIDRTYYDEETLFKVNQVLSDYGFEPSEATDLISQLQNVGILFRERSDDNAKIWIMSERNVGGTSTVKAYFSEDKAREEAAKFGTDEEWNPRAIVYSVELGDK